VISWKDLVSLGKDKSEDLLAERQKQLAINQVSILPIFYEQLFCAKVFFTAFLCYQSGFVIFGKSILEQKLCVKCW
jgi:hypothetical protein